MKDKDKTLEDALEDIKITMMKETLLWMNGQNVPYSYAYMMVLLHQKFELFSGTNICVTLLLWSLGMVSVATVSLVTNVFRIVAMVMHGLGSYLLLCLYEEGFQDPAKILLINLSVSEILFNFFDLLSTPLSNIDSSYLNQGTTLAQDYIIIVNGYGIVSAYFLSMIFLTLDRLLEILLSINYPVYCTPKRTKYLMIGMWLICLLIGASLAVAHNFTNTDLINPMVFALYPSFEVVFIVVAFSTYGFLFHKYRKSRVPPVRISGMRARAPSVLQVFQTSKFYVAVLLIASFLLFITTPDLMYSFGVATQYNKADTVNEFCRMSIAVGCVCDAIIYIFMSPPVKRLLMKKVKRIFCCRKWKRNNRVGAIVGGRPSVSSISATIPTTA